MRIGIFSECYKPTKNGVVVSIETFREQFEKKGHEVFVFAPRTKGYKEENDRTFRFPSIKFPGQAYYPIGIPFSPKNNRKVGELNLDIIHCQSLFPISRYGRAMARKCNIPVIMTYHTLIEDYVHYVPLLHGLAKKVIIKLSQKFANSMDHVVTPSQPIKEMLEERYKVTSPISVIPTGIKVEKVPDVDASEVKKKYMIPHNRKLVFYGGRLSKEKNVEMLIRAFARLKKMDPNVHLIIAGDGPEKEHYHELIEKFHLLDHTTFEGFISQEDIYWLFAGADVFAFPSITDTQGIVVLEAFAGRTPVVAVNVLGPSKLINDGINGYLTKNDPEDFAKKIYKVIKNPDFRERLAQNARKRSEDFTAEKMADKMLDLYDLVIKQKSIN